MCGLCRDSALLDGLRFALVAVTLVQTTPLSTKKNMGAPSQGSAQAMQPPRRLQEVIIRLFIELFTTQQAREATAHVLVLNADFTTLTGDYTAPVTGRTTNRSAQTSRLAGTGAGVGAGAVGLGAGGCTFCLTSSFLFSNLKKLGSPMSQPYHLPSRRTLTKHLRIQY